MSVVFNSALDLIAQARGMGLGAYFKTFRESTGYLIFARKKEEREEVINLAEQYFGWVKLPNACPLRLYRPNHIRRVNRNVWFVESESLLEQPKIEYAVALRVEHLDDLIMLDRFCEKYRLLNNLATGLPIGSWPCKAFAITSFGTIYDRLKTRIAQGIVHRRSVQSMLGLGA